MNQKVVEVAIGLIYSKGHLLVGWREEHLHQGGRYEFPGGKIEQDENPEQALIRELKEETGLDVEIFKLFTEQRFDYPDRKVNLYFYWCHPLHQLSEEKQKLWHWIPLNQLQNYTFPEANQPIIQRLNWSQHLAISTEDITRLQTTVELCYLKHNFKSRAELSAIFNYCKQAHIQPILNLKYYQELAPAEQDKVFAVHLNSGQLFNHDLAREQFKHKNFIAACHNLQDIERANQLGCDAILLSPVQATPSHPEQMGIGWQKFGMLAQAAKMPVYALGGVAKADLAIAKSYGAYGIAGIRPFLLN